MGFFIGVILFIAAIFGFNWFMGYKKDNITLDLEDRYTNLQDYAEAVKQELENRGKTVTSRRNRYFNIDGKSYVLVERNVSMGGVPLQHTILKRTKRMSD
ncbi:hypothetical protein [Tuberibacillus sp. Marseille-P3662]|uniref:hypothetical protein n=1 Tax=Tuberibacillus sp. Marseille-P3662 TaxID=1965358 RepID=UPI0020CAD498|nr:hypothetical protein [Tuberibacillus sp. Marseille-P3662]